MKKRIFAFFLILSLTSALFANEDDPYYGSGFDWAIKAGFSLPIIPFAFDSGSIGDIGIADNEYFEYALVSIILGSVTLGGGIQYTIIPHVLTPGIYFDAHFNLISWGAVYLFSEYHIIFFQTGVQIFNRFEINYFGIEPFFGANILYLAMDNEEIPFTLLKAGINLNFNLFNIEYAYNFYPIQDAKNENPFLAYHRITFSWKLNGY